MSHSSIRPANVLPAAGVPGGIWRKDDWWAVAIGLGLVALAYVLFASGSSLAWIAVIPAKWSTFDQLLGHFAAN